MAKVSRQVEKLKAGVGALSAREPYTRLADGLGWSRIWWWSCNSGFLRERGNRAVNEVTDPPTNGWSSVVVIDKEGSKYVTLFCPFTFGSWQVSRNSSEYMSLYAMPSEVGRLELHLPERWDEIVRLGLTGDFDTAAKVFTMMGIPVPTTTSGQKDVNKVRGGKEVSKALSRPVKRGSRRGQVLAFFLEKPGSSIRVAMAEIGITRSNVLSQCFVLQRDHGIGYEVKGDTVLINLPEGCNDPWLQQTDAR